MQSARDGYHGLTPKQLGLKCNVILTLRSMGFLESKLQAKCSESEAPVL